MREALKRLINWDLAALLVLLFVANLPCLSGTFLPHHDSFQGFQPLHYFYSAFYHHGELAQWSPYNFFGTTTTYFQFGFLTPATWFAMFVGRILRIEDFLLVYRLSMFLYQVLFLFGVYLLARALCFRRLTTILVCACATLSAFWHCGPGFGLGMIALFPFVLYFIVLFFQRHDPAYFWLAGIFSFVGLLGNVPYAAPLWLFAGSIAVIPLFWRDRRALGCLFSFSFSNIFLFVVFLLVSGCVIYFAANMMDSFVVFRPGRDPNTGIVSLGSFVASHDLNADFLSILRIYFTGWPLSMKKWPPTGDCTYYVGLLPMLCLLWGLARVRTRWFFAFVVPAIALFWLSLGGFFTAVCYFFPGMFLYRYVGFVHGLARIFLVFAAGFGFEDFWRRMKAKHFVLGAIGLVLICDVFSFPVHERLGELRRGLLPWTGLDGLRGLGNEAVTFLRFLGYIVIFLICAVCVRGGVRKRRPALSRSPSWRAVVAFLLVAYGVADVMIYRGLVFREIRGYEWGPSRSVLYGCLDAHKLTYRDRRTESTSATLSDRQEDALVLASLQSVKGEVYTTSYDLAQHDVCWPDYFYYFLTPEMAQLLSARGWGKPYFELQDPRKDDRPFMRVLGCDAPKLRFVSAARRAASVEEAKEIIRNTRNLDEIVILRAGPTDAHGVSEPSSAPAARADIQVRRFSANELVVEANVDGGGWLVYADSYTPGWRAEVDGRAAEVEQAYLAFKAVHLTTGRHRVRFFYHRGWPTYSSYLIAAVGLVASSVLLSLFLVVLVRPAARLSGEQAALTAGRWAPASAVVKGLVIVGIVALAAHLFWRNPARGAADGRRQAAGQWDAELPRWKKRKGDEQRGHSLLKIAEAQCSSSRAGYGPHLLIDDRVGVGRCAWFSEPSPVMPQRIELRLAEPARVGMLGLQSPEGVKAANDPDVFAGAKCTPRAFPVQGIADDGSLIDLGEHEISERPYPGLWYYIRLKESSVPLAGIVITVKTNHGTPKYVAVGELAVYGARRPDKQGDVTRDRGVSLGRGGTATRPGQ